MGAGCTADTYSQIREKYGYELSRMVIVEKNRIFLDRIIGKLKKEISEVAAQYESNMIVQIERKEDEMKEIYRKAKEELDNRQPGGVRSLQQMSKKRAEDLLGYTYIQNMFSQLKINVKTKFKSDEIAMIDELLQIKLAQQEVINEDKPIIGPFNDLNEDEQEAIIKRGEMQFHKQIVKYQEYLLTRYGDRLSKQFYSQRLSGVSCRESLDNLVVVAKDKFCTSLNLILSQRIGSYVIFK